MLQSKQGLDKRGVPLVYSLLADMTAIVHGLFVVFVLAGGLLALKCRWIVLLHFPIAVYGVLIMVFDWPCPLTRLEIALRELAGEPVQWSEFLEHYFFSHFGLTGGEWFVLAALVVALPVFNSRPYWRAIRG